MGVSATMNRFPPRQKSISSLERRGLNPDIEYTEFLSNFYRIEQSNITPLYSEVSEFEFLPRN
jgi:hypothetical protein